MLFVVNSLFLLQCLSLFHIFWSSKAKLENKWIYWCLSRETVLNILTLFVFFSKTGCFTERNICISCYILGKIITPNMCSCKACAKFHVCSSYWVCNWAASGSIKETVVRLRKNSVGIIKTTTKNTENLHFNVLTFVL